ncbi:aminotransferase class III-fold pyridoxal phosphate-dependent enzyme [Reichenbachiella ulvae]|uniref:Aminotransferase class III-fold pyridoxal phosphate-dependent enzyme n=1 Tax=Reichenbachiella ulvae TaxID=2980104 RepID=A0ABT3CPW2_9BACT|nr:aminotransferase class III-fold pyridoxal phosphate-dependent enzyme [Reichenbachiella ulvae]MCV9385652.1 aminotransferase class III-fold pyridoxal phosphate-dependent enzyme [Reichenbachiella ulvae]
MAQEKKQNYFESITAPYKVSEGNMLAKLKAAMVGHIGAQEIDVRKSKGSYMFVPSENRSVLDMNQSLSAKALSYNHPVFDDPEYKELMALYSNNRLSYSTYHNEDFAKATEVIMNRFVKPGGFDHIFYISGGAKSVEVAVHIAIINKVEKNMQAGKGEIGNAMISLFGDFHGRGLGLRNLTTSVPEKNEYLPTFSTWKTLPPPLSEEEVPGALKKLEELIQEVGPDNLAGFIAEDMIQCGWGDRFIPASFYHGVRKLADQYDFYVIYDAVQTGMYASGMPFAHQALEAASPDIVAGCKKAYTGYVLVKEKIREVKGNAIDSTISINSTWGGHLPDIITWAYVLESIEQDDLVGNIKARGAQMLEGLKGIANKYDEVSNARGIGLMGLSLSAPSGEFLGKVKAQCYKNGLNIFPGTTPAPDGYAIRYRPVLDVTEDEIAKTIQITDQSIGEIL